MLWKKIFVEEFASKCIGKCNVLGRKCIGVLECIWLCFGRMNWERKYFARRQPNIAIV